MTLFEKRMQNLFLPFLCSSVFEDENEILSMELTKVERPTWMIWKAEVWIRQLSDSQSPAFGGHSTFINSFCKTKFSCFTLLPTQHHSFFRN